MPTNLDPETLRAPMVHDLKVWPSYFTLLATGRKPFELRKLDRDYYTGDTLRLREWNPDTKMHTGRELSRVVTCVLVGEPWLAPGYCAMGLAEAAPPRPAQVRQCDARHAETGARCELPLDHVENHRGRFAHGIAQWPYPDSQPTPPPAAQKERWEPWTAGERLAYEQGHKDALQVAEAEIVRLRAERDTLKQRLIDNEATWLDTQERGILEAAARTAAQLIAVVEQTPAAQGFPRLVDRDAVLAALKAAQTTDNGDYWQCPTCTGWFLKTEPHVCDVREDDPE